MSTHNKTVGSYEAKTHLPALLDSVEELGEKIVITRKGIPVAMLVPYQEEKTNIDEAINAILEFRKNIHLKGLSIQEMKEEGRRY
jgi:prevent-host-death family protein